MAILAFLIPIATLGVIVLFVVGAQQLKRQESGGFIQVFYTVVALVMLAFTVGSSVIMIDLVGREYVFQTPQDKLERSGQPPPLFFTKDEGRVPTSAYACTDSCEFTDEEELQFQNWKSDYLAWTESSQANTTQFRRDLIGPLAFLIVGLPLFVIFIRLMERGDRKRKEAGEKPSSIRQVYYYYTAFGGLLMIVFGAAILITSGLKLGLGTESDIAVVEPAVLIDQEYGIESVLHCADQCGFSEDDVRLAEAWLIDSQEYRDSISGSTSSLRDDLAGAVPVLLAGIPLFWYHFARIRKETAEVPPGSTEATKPA